MSQSWFLETRANQNAHCCLNMWDERRGIKTVQSPIKWETWSTLCVTTHVHLYTAASTPGKRTRNKSPRSSFLRLIIVLQQEQTHLHLLSGWFCNHVHRWFPTKTHWKKNTHTHTYLFLSSTAVRLCDKVLSHSLNSFCSHMYPASLCLSLFRSRWGHGRLTPLTLITY